MTELNDELLVAYVDGQLAKDQSKAIERVLEEDDVAARRVEALRTANTHLETAFEAMLAGQPIPVPAAEAGTQGGAGRTLFSLFRRSAAFAWVGFGCLLGGAAGGFILYDLIAADPFTAAAVAPAQGAAKPAPPGARTAPAPVQPAWADDVAHAHALLSPETFSFGLESEGNMDLTGFQISKTLGTSLSVPDLSGEKLIFQRAQMLQRDGRPFAQIAYLSESGVPVALYATVRTGVPEPLKLDEKQGIGLASWTQGELSLLLAGDLPDARLQKLAGAVESQFAAGVPRAQDTGIPETPSAAEEAEQSGAAAETDAGLPANGQ